MPRRASEVGAAVWRVRVCRHVSQERRRPNSTVCRRFCSSTHVGSAVEKGGTPVVNSQENKKRFGRTCWWRRTTCVPVLRDEGGGLQAFVDQRESPPRGSASTCSGQPRRKPLNPPRFARGGAGRRSSLVNYQCARRGRQVSSRRIESETQSAGVIEDRQR